MEKVSNYAFEKEITFYTGLKYAGEIGNLGRAAAKIQSFVTEIEVLRAKAANMSVDKLIKEIIEDTGYYDYIESEADTDEEVTERRQNIDELISKAVIYEETADEPTLSGFLEEVALVADIDNLDEAENRVSLMTIHSAKGLEFPVVYLAGMEDGLFPSYMSISSGDESDIEEERRLCYVGITRAKNKLIMSAAKVRMVRGEMNMNRTSRFVNEIPKEWLQQSAQSGRRQTILREDDHMNLPPRKYGQVAFASFQKEAIKAGTFDKQPSGINNGELGYAVGDRVKHIKFGEGTVMEIKGGGRDYEVTVSFDSAGTKKMFASFAKLAKI
jgi:DNA helicase-2/ATP-dependent DNA helicase PcrA